MEPYIKRLTRSNAGLLHAFELHFVGIINAINNTFIDSREIKLRIRRSNANQIVAHKER